MIFENTWYFNSLVASWAIAESRNFQIHPQKSFELSGQFMVQTMRCARGNSHLPFSKPIVQFHEPASLRRAISKCIELAHQTSILKRVRSAKAVILCSDHRRGTKVGCLRKLRVCRYVLRLQRSPFMCFMMPLDLYIPIRAVGSPWPVQNRSEATVISPVLTSLSEPFHGSGLERLTRPQLRSERKPYKGTQS